MPIDAETFEGGERRYSVENDVVRFLYDNDGQAYSVREIAVAVLDPDWAGRAEERSPDSAREGPDLDSDLESASEGPESEYEAIVECVLDLATVTTILDGLVDIGSLERRIVDVGGGERSYYRAR